MEELSLTVPRLWADHHVLVVRDLLAEVDGVSGVVASPLEHNLRVTYDPTKIDAAAVESTLTEAGYRPGPPEDDSAAPTSKPEWATGQLRRTTTVPADLAMSGDYRKY